MVLETASQSSMGFHSDHVVKTLSIEPSLVRSLMGGTIPELEEMLDGLTVWAHNTYGVDELVAAREIFHAQTGKVFPDDPMHLTRTAYFFDHFLFERPVRHGLPKEQHLLAATPYEIFCCALRATARPEPDLWGRLLGLSNYRHSLFSIERVAMQNLVVQDLASKERLAIIAKPGESFRALQKSQVIQGFVYRFGNAFQLSPGLILHPQGASKFLRKTIDLLRNEALFSRRVFLAKTAYVNMRHLRLKHVDPKVTYKTEFEAFAAAAP